MNIWSFIARIILRNRILILSIIGLFTAFMLYQATDVKIAYRFAKILPDTDSISIDFAEFEREFGNANNTVIIAVEAPKSSFFTKEYVSDWKYLVDSLNAIDGIVSSFSITEAYNLEIDSVTDLLGAVNLMPNPPTTDQEVELFKSQIENLPFYEGMLFNDDRSVFIMLTKIDASILYTKKVTSIVQHISRVVKDFEAKTGSATHISGVPFLLFANAQKLQAEIRMFIILTVIVTALILFIFLRSFRATGISLLVVFIGVISTFGLFGTFNYEVSLVGSLIPPLVIVIGIPNCIYLINKYHSEYKLHKNKVLALQRVIRKIGYVTLLTNLTTALGFAAFILTESVTMVEFGVVTSINILIIFVLSITIIPILYSYSRPPKERHYKHLEQKWIVNFIKSLEYIVENKRTAVYTVTIILVSIGIYGLFQLTTSGNMTDDFSENDPVLKDMEFIQDKFNGVVPLEIVVDTKKKKGILKTKVIKDINAFQQRLANDSLLSRSMSYVDVIKFATQGVKGGAADMYALPTRQEKGFVMSSLPKNGDFNQMSAYVDSTRQRARISFQIQDLQTADMRAFRARLQEVIDEAFDPEDYNILVTGAGIKFLRSTTFLVRNLVISLSLAIVVISILMSLLFGSVRMVFISVVPNFIPLLLTGGIMGLFGIPLKPSTILVFSIAFGISVDDTIHFLAKYRQELSQHGWNIAKSVKLALQETGVSMFYTSIVLFFGFSIFMASEFGGSQALGFLVAITLFFAMFSNLVILPSFLMTMDKWVSAKNFSDTILAEKLEEVNDK